MKISATELPEALLIEPVVFGDDRGFFFESFNRRVFQETAEIDVEFVQDNHSLSEKNVLRGLHYQIQQPQGKLVRVVSGSVFDVIVDLRKSSPRFGKFSCVVLSAENKHMLWVPPGFAHGFLVTSDSAEFLYKVTDYRAPQYERTLLWNDAALGIPWPLSADPVLSKKDREGVPLEAAEVYP